MVNIVVLELTLFASNTFYIFHLCGSTKLLNMDLIWIRIHNTAFELEGCSFFYNYIYNFYNATNT